MHHSLVGYKPFYDVKTAEDLEVAKGRAAIYYDAYVSIVQRIAANYDNRNSFKQKQRNDIWQVHQTNINYEETDFGQTQDSIGNDMEEMIGTFGSISIHEARQNNFQNCRRPSIRREALNSLSAEDQSAWYELSNKGKMSILCLHLNIQMQRTKFPRWSARSIKLLLKKQKSFQMQLRHHKKTNRWHWLANPSSYHEETSRHLQYTIFT